MVILAAGLYAVATAVIVGFQLALAAGKPWGEFAMGGRFPGQFPIGMRVAAVVQAAVLTGLAVIVLGAAGLLDVGGVIGHNRAVWVVVGISVISLAMNLATPSPRERAVWAPVALLMVISSSVVALAQ